MMETLPQAKNFLELDESISNLQKSQVVILPVPYEKSPTFIQGTRKGPEAILTASKYLEDYDDELNLEPCTVGIATLVPINLKGGNNEQRLDKIGQKAATIMKTGKFLISLGGEHSITIPLVREANQIFTDLAVLHLDAHSDLRDSYMESRLNHACVMARINEICDFVSIGLRSGLKEDRQNLRPGAHLFYAIDMVHDPDWPEKVLECLPDNVYLTIDLDFFDPSIMPAVGTPEPGGFLWYETLEFLRIIFREKNVVACDVVELSPIAELVHPNFFAAKLVYKLIGYKFFIRGR